MNIVEAMMMKICRLCTKEQSEGARMYHIFQRSEPRAAYMLSRVTWVTNLEIRHDDGLPRQICQECFTQLNQSYTFKQRCYASDRELRHFLQTLRGELGNLTSSETVSESSNTNNQEPLCNKTSAMLSNKMTCQEIKRKQNKQRVSHSKHHNTSQANVFIPRDKFFEKVPDAEMPCQELIIKTCSMENKCLTTPAQPSIANQTNGRPLHVSRQVYNMEINDSCTNAQLDFNPTRTVCSHELHENRVAKRENESCEKESLDSESQLTQASTSKDILVEVTATNKKPISKMLNHIETIRPSKISKKSMESSIIDSESCSKEVRFYCFPCKASFTDSNKLEKHLTSHSTTEGNLLDCAASKKTYINSSSFDMEPKSHSTDKITNIEKIVITDLHFDPKVALFNKSVCKETQHKTSRPHESVSPIPSEVQTKTSQSGPNTLNANKESEDLETHTKVQTATSQSESNIVNANKESDYAERHTKVQTKAGQTDSIILNANKESEDLERHTKVQRKTSQSGSNILNVYKESEDLEKHTKIQRKTSQSDSNILNANKESKDLERHTKVQRKTSQLDSNILNAYKESEDLEKHTKIQRKTSQSDSNILNATKESKDLERHTKIQRKTSQLDSNILNAYKESEDLERHTIQRKASQSDSNILNANKESKDLEKHTKVQRKTSQLDSNILNAYKESEDLERHTKIQRKASQSDSNILNANKESKDLERHTKVQRKTSQSDSNILNVNKESTDLERHTKVQRKVSQSDSNILNANKESEDLERHTKIQTKHSQSDSNISNANKESQDLERHTPLDSAVPAITVQSNDQHSTNIKNETQTVEVSVCVLKQNVSELTKTPIFPKVVLERCDSHDSLSEIGRDASKLKANNNPIKVQENSVIKTTTSAKNRKTSKEADLQPLEYSKGINSKYRKNNTGYMTSSKSTQKEVQKKVHDTAGSAGKKEFENLGKANLLIKSSGSSVQNLEPTINKALEPQETSDLGILEEKRDLETVVISCEQNTNTLTHSTGNVVESKSNDNPQNLSNGEPSLKYKKCRQKTAVLKGTLSKISKLGENRESVLKRQHSQISKQEGLNNLNKNVEKVESKQRTEDKINDNANQKDLNNTHSIQIKGSTNSKSNLQSFPSREIPPEMLDFHSLTNMLKSQFVRKTYPCTVCKKTFSRRNELTNHLRLHTGETPFSCHECGIKYSKKRHLIRHIRVHHITDKPFKCEICPKSFLRRNDLEAHIRLHNNDRPFRCSLCPKAYTISQNLQTHLLSHSGERNFHCTLCTKSFWLKSILKAHLHTHITEKNFICTLCPKAFKTERALKNHQRTHTQERSYKCKLCPATYIHATNFREHMRKHSGETFDCTICKKSFVKRTTLREHLVAHTGKRMFECVPCGKTFLHKSGWFKHKATKHANVEVPMQTEMEPDLQK